MKTKLLLLPLLAALGSTAMAQDEGRKGPPPAHRGGPQGPCKDDSTSTECKTMREGMELRKAEWKARSAYFKAVKDNKDQAARKTELLAAMDKLNAFEKAHVEEMAKAMVARSAKDTAGRDGDCRHDKAPRDGKGPRGDKGGPQEGQPPRPEGPDEAGAPDMPPPPEGGEFR